MLVDEGFKKRPDIITVAFLYLLGTAVSLVGDKGAMLNTAFTDWLRAES